MRTVMPLISTFLYNGAWKSSSLSSSGGALKKEENHAFSKIIFRNFIFYETFTSCINIPFGITPGSMNVASVKFAKTKKVMTP